ncbi:Disease resistance protein [Quillaja saponaria]|uniref:Disease resistance protein n=1 Tax=Quillaja saponaria TaxID=32244 RepID=A0AAD7M0Z8_QUISA|nr:Disease resistance protein [Quillaja saponaria]
MEFVDRDKAKVWAKHAESIIADIRIKRARSDFKEFVGSLAEKVGNLDDAIGTLLEEYDHIMDAVIALTPKDIADKMYQGDEKKKRVFNAPRRRTEGSSPQGHKGKKIVEVAATYEVKLDQTATASKTTLREGEVMEEEKLHVPEAILDLAIDLAIAQFEQNLSSGDDTDIHHVRFITKTNDIQKRSLLEKLRRARVAKNQPIAVLNVSTFESKEEAQEEITQMLQYFSSDHTPTAGRVMSFVILLDDNQELLDIHDLAIPKTNFGGVVVVIGSNGSSAVYDEIADPTIFPVDLEIRIEDHLLSWELFCWNSNVRVQGSSSSPISIASTAIQETAVHIVEQCHGHLLAVLLMARSLRNVDEITIWNLALDRLTSSIYPYQQYCNDITSRIMFSASTYVWERLNNMMKHCLRDFCAIEETEWLRKNTLISHWIDGGLVHTHDEGEHIMEGLTSMTAVLLEKKDDLVILPKETKETLLFLLQNDHSKLYPLYLNKDRSGLTEPPKDEEWDAIEIHLADNELFDLPNAPRCPSLKALFLNGNFYLTEISSSFFHGMPLLQVLNLSYTSIRDLPESFFNLVELREFILRGCQNFNLELPSRIGQLQKLEKLDLGGTEILHMPKEIAALVHLRRLALSFCWTGCISGTMTSCTVRETLQQSSTVIPPGVLSNLSWLTELSIDVNPEDQRWATNVEVIIMEVCRLIRLETLELYIPKVKDLSPLIQVIGQLFPKSLSFRLIVGHHMKRIISRVPLEVEAEFWKWDKCLKFVNGVDIPDEVKTVLTYATALYLDRQVTIARLSKIFGIRSLTKLKFCIIAECHEMKTIVAGEDFYEEGDGAMQYGDDGSTNNESH